MILVTGGGTGGHLYPGLAAANALVKAGETVTYIGAKGGLEERVLPDSKLPYRIIPAGKFSREALKPSEGIKVFQGLWEAYRLLNELKPKAVLSTGGYAGFSVAFVGSLLGIPVVIHEANNKLGLAARWLASRAKRIMLSTPFAMPAELQVKTEVVGLPVREEKFAPEEARARLGLDPNHPTIFVMGGSQGSKELNENLPERLYPLLEKGWQVLHQCGRRWETEMSAKAKPYYLIQGYVDTGLAWSAADFAITRGGAGTLAEAAYHGVPVLGIPLPAEMDSGAQQANVRFYAEQGGARLLKSWADFDQELNPLLEPSTRRQMHDRLLGLSPEGAAERLATAVLEVAR